MTIRVADVRVERRASDRRDRENDSVTDLSPAPVVDEPRRERRRWWVRSVAISVTAGALAVACGGDEPETRADIGRRTAIAANCASCHGTDGQGGVGPGWVGLFGSEVELEDGSTVLADEAYLVRAILEPDAEIRPGWDVRMPTNALTEAEALDIVAFIETLTDAP